MELRVRHSRGGCTTQRIQNCEGLKRPGEFTVWHLLVMYGKHEALWEELSHSWHQHPGCWGVLGPFFGGYWKASDAARPSLCHLHSRCPAKKHHIDGPVASGIPEVFSGARMTSGIPLVMMIYPASATISCNSSSGRFINCKALSNPYRRPKPHSQTPLTSLIAFWPSLPACPTGISN